MEIDEKLHTRPMALVLTAAGLALLLVTVLSLSLSARAEPVDADLEVNKQVNTDQAAPDDVLTYTIHITNNTFTAAALWMTDTLPPEVDYVAGSLQVFGAGSADVTDDVLTWSVGSFGYHEEVIIIFSAQISSAITSATITNTAEVTGTGSLVTSNMVSTGVSPGELQVSKEAGSAFARAGEQLGYSIHISNVGGGAVSAVSMTDPLPPEVSYASGLSVSGWADGSCGVSGDVITCTGRMEPAEEATVDFTVDVSAVLSEGTYFTNTVYVGGAGLPLSASVTTQVSEDVLCYLPFVLNDFPPQVVLHPIPTPGVNNSYVVSWDPITGTTQYVLQESTNSSFSTFTEWQTTDTSRAFQKETAVGTYYYRARADGPWGQGVWSQVRSVSAGFSDDFSNPSSGWPDVAVKMVGSSYYRLRYDNGVYRITLDPGGPEVWFHQPTALAPYVVPVDKYCVEVDVRIVKGQYPYGDWNFYPYWANGGLVFGSNESKTKLYAMCLAIGAEQSYHGPADLGWFVVNNSNSVWPYEGCHSAGGYTPAGESVGLSTEQWHHFQVGVDGNNVTVYLNGVNKGTWGMPGLTNMTRVGVVGGDYEVTPVDFRFDNFKVIPNYDCTP
jgi:uncharacterized repeat protein (TIGR01451 family)